MAKIRRARLIVRVFHYPLSAGHNLFLRVVKSVIKSFGSLLLTLLTALLGIVSFLKYATRGFSSAGSAHDTTKEYFKQAFSGFKNFFNELSTDIKEFCHNSVENLKQTYTILKHEIPLIAHEVKETATAVVKPIVSFFVNIGEKLGNGLLQVKSNAEKFREYELQVKENIDANSASAYQDAKQCCNKLRETLKIPLLWIRSLAQKLNPKDFFEKFKNKIKGTNFKSLEIKTEITEGFPTIREAIKNVIVYIKNVFVGAFEFVKNSRITKFIASIIHGTIGFVLATEKTLNETSWITYLYLGIIVFALFYLATLIYETYMKELYYRTLLEKIPNKIRDGCKDFILQDPTLLKLMEKLMDQIKLGLDPKTNHKSSVKCYNTYVQDLPSGNENGQFLALDLGGTNFRVLLISLHGKHFEMQSKIYTVPSSLMLGPGENLFDHIATCLESFTHEHKVADKNLALGFTFSFPLKQNGLTEGILKFWTKGFNCSGVVDEDVVQLLRKAISKKSGLDIDVVAILNDTTGTLMSCAWKNHNCKMGVILGTGTNACYVEEVSNVIGFEGEPNKQTVIINTEWGAFGQNGELDSLRTSFDKEIDKASINAGKQIFEKMISGMYLGEIVRLLLVKFVKDKIIFQGCDTTKLFEQGSFKTEYISEIESDKRGIFKNCRKALAKICIKDVGDQDCSNVRYICECVSRRAAQLASAGIATLINKMDVSSLTVGVDGSLYRYHPHFHDLMVEKIQKLVNPSIKHINLMLSEDGSGRGAALVAASSHR